MLLDFAGNTGPPRSFHDVLDTTMTVGASGRFAWHLNPSTRPGAATPESWTVTCERPAGNVLARGSVVVGRGERKALDLCALRFSLAVDRAAWGGRWSAGCAPARAARLRARRPWTSASTTRPRGATG